MKITPTHSLRLSSVFFAALLGLVAKAADVDAIDPSLAISPARMREFDRWRFGLFVHWGPWSQTAKGSIWNIVRSMNDTQRAEAFQLYRTFNPTAFDPKKWATAAHDAGMKYVVFVTKHHDGFNNFDTRLSDHRITAPESPFATDPRADLTRAVTDAFRAQGFAIGLYYSHIDWYHPDGKYFSASSPVYDRQRVETDPASWHRFADYEKGQVRELLSNYGKVDLLWFDIMWPFAGTRRTRVSNPVVRADVLDLLHEMKSLQPDIIFNDRGTDVYGGFITPEQMVPDQGYPGSWETCMTITNGAGFWFKGRDADCKPPEQVIRTLIEVASKGGNLLLDVGPGPNGDFIPGEYKTLAGVGRWLNVNGAAIYGTERSLWSSLPWGHSTTHGRTLYLFVNDWPADGRLVVPGLRSAVKSAQFLADPSHPPLAVEARGMDKIITVGPHPLDPAATVVTVDLASDPDVVNLVQPDRAGLITLAASHANVNSAAAYYDAGHTVHRADYITDLRSPADRVMWDFFAAKAGRYQVTLTYAALPSQAGATFTLQLNSSASLKGTTQKTASWQGSLAEAMPPGQAAGSGQRDNTWAFETQDLGLLKIASLGPQKLVLSPTQETKEGVFYLRSVTLTPVQP